MIKESEGHKMEIKKGLTRVVFIFKKFVIKIPNFTTQFDHGRCGILANLNERNYNGKHECFAKVYFSSIIGLWVVMEYIDPLPKYLDYKLRDYVYGYYKNDPLYTWITEDCKPSNWGVKDGNLIKIDYA